MPPIDVKFDVTVPYSVMQQILIDLNDIIGSVQGIRTRLRTMCRANYVVHNADAAASHAANEAAAATTSASVGASHPQNAGAAVRRRWRSLESTLAHEGADGPTTLRGTFASDDAGRAATLGDTSAPDAAAGLVALGDVPASDDAAELASQLGVDPTTAATPSAAPLLPKGPAASTSLVPNGAADPAADRVDTDELGHSGVNKKKRKHEEEATAADDADAAILYAIFAGDDDYKNYFI